MNMHPFRQEEPEINLISLVDVVLLLLIFLLVSTRFMPRSGLQVDLPEATTPSFQQADNPIRISINQEGEMAVNGRRLADSRLATLVAALKKAAGGREHVRVIISADAKAAYHAVVTAMDAARQLGWTHLSLATERRRSRP